MEFHQRLAELRRQKGLTQEQLAERLYVSRAAVSKWESGRGLPSIDSLQAIARLFSISLDELLSTGEAISIAEADNRKNQTRTRDLMVGMLDLGALLLLLLPLFALRTEGGVQAVSIAALGVSPYLRILYYGVVSLTAVAGALTLALQAYENRIWARIKLPLSLALGTADVLLFTVSQQPYAAVFAFALLAAKVIPALRSR